MRAVAKDSRSEPGAVCSQVSVCAGRGGGGGGGGGEGGGGGTGGVYLFCDMCHTLAHSMHILCTTHAHSLCRESAALNERSYKQFCSLELVLPASVV